MDASAAGRAERSLDCATAVAGRIVIALDERLRIKDVYFLVVVWPVLVILLIGFANTC